MQEILFEKLTPCYMKKKKSLIEDERKNKAQDTRVYTLFKTRKVCPTGELVLE